jgi:hypothetical protein
MSEAARRCGGPDTIARLVRLHSARRDARKEGCCRSLTRSGGQLIPGPGFWRAKLTAPRHTVGTLDTT